MTEGLSARDKGFRFGGSPFAFPGRSGARPTLASMTNSAGKGGGKGNFGGKRAAPYKQGGGRNKQSPRNHKGEPRRGKGGK